MIKYFCDRCGNEITGAIGRIQIAIGDSPRFREEGQADYCVECIEEIVSLIRAAPAEPETKAPEPKEKKSAPKRIDYGKIMALKRAGWGNQQIAEEMQMSKNALAQAICTYRKKKGLQEQTEVVADD